MASFTYTSLRNLKAGHSAGTDYTITVNLQQADEQISPQHSQNMALSGNSVTVAHRIDQIINITTDYINAGTTPDVDDMLEFMWSVAHNESFTYNDGTDKTVKLQGAPTRNKAGIYWSWSFSIRVIS